MFPHKRSIDQTERLIWKSLRSFFSIECLLVEFIICMFVPLFLVELFKVNG